MKNLKLLLATTAILSAAVATSVKADDPVTAANYGGRESATLSANITILSPINMSNGHINFPVITTSNVNNYESVKVKVNYDGTIDYANSTAQIVYDGVTATPVVITGGDISRYKSYFENYEGDELAQQMSYYNGADGSWSGKTYNLAIDDTIPMYEAGSDTPCGEVSELQRYWYFDKSLDSNKGGFKVNFGGTFTLDNDYNPTSGRATCQGSTTVSFILWGDSF